MKPLFLSIVTPAFNEEKNFLAGVLVPSFDFLRKQKYSWEIIFVDDGSIDKTKTLLAKLCRRQKHCKLLSTAHGGRASAMRVGMKSAQGKYILYTDFDQSTSLSEVTAFLKKMRSENFDLVIGARGFGKTERKDSWLNKRRAEVFVLIARFLMGLEITDINCGFKLYRKEVAHIILESLIVSRPRKIKHAYMGAIDSEILFLARKFKYNVAQLPVNWVRRPFVSHLDWKEPIMIIFDLLAMRWNDVRGHYQLPSRNSD